MQIISNSFLLVAASEMGDKTQLLALSLAARYKKPWPIMAGIFVATILNHYVASFAGQYAASFFRNDIMGIILGISFIIFGFWTLKPDELDEKSHHPKFGAFLTTTILFFLAEMGDKTQLATVALGAQFKSAIPVTIGTTLGMLFSDGLAVFVGEKLAEKINMKWIRWFASFLFFAFGLLTLFQVIIKS